MKTKQRPSLVEPKSKKRFFLPLFLGFIMVLSTFAIIFSGPGDDSSQVYKYKDTYFRKTNRGWEASYQGQELVFQYGPEELASLFPDSNLKTFTALRSLEKIYISTLPGEQVQPAMRELYAHGNSLPLLTFACVEDREECGDMPVKDCTAASDTTAVLILRLGNVTSLTSEDHCSTLTGNSIEELVQLVDKGLLYFYGVLP